MKQSLSEALLEMHFHSALVGYYSNMFGANFLSLYKPTPQREAWVGFDQGWTCSDLTNDQLFEEIKESISREENTSIDSISAIFCSSKP